MYYKKVTREQLCDILSNLFYSWYRTWTQIQTNILTLPERGEGKVVSVLNQASQRKDVWGSRGIAPGIPKLGTRWR